MIYKAKVLPYDRLEKLPIFIYGSSDEDADWIKILPGHKSEASIITRARELAGGVKASIKLKGGPTSGWSGLAKDVTAHINIRIKGSATSGWYAPGKGTHTGEAHRKIGYGKAGAKYGTKAKSNKSTIVPGIPDRILHISEPDSDAVTNTLDDLRMVPSELHEKLVAAGLNGIYIGDKPMTKLDNNQAMSGVTPRGWPPGSTWDLVPGCYNTASKQLTLGSGRSGSVSLALHEYGHAVGDLLGYDSSQSLIDEHTRMYNAGILEPYQRQGGAGGLAGRQEAFAEGFAEQVSGRQYSTRGVVDDRFRSFIRYNVLTGL